MASLEYLEPVVAAQTAAGRRHGDFIAEVLPGGQRGVAAGGTPKALSPSLNMPPKAADAPPATTAANNTPTPNRESSSHGIPLGTVLSEPLN